MTSWKASLGVSLLLLAAANLGCGPAGASGDNEYTRLYRAQEVKEFDHPNGLSLRLPVSLAVTETADGFIITPPQVRSLSPLTIRLQLNEEPPAMGRAKQQLVGNRRINYRVTKHNEGGSGGAEYELIAWEMSPSTIVTYQQTEQSEMSQPRYEFAWYVIEQSGVSSGRKQ